MNIKVRMDVGGRAQVDDLLVIDDAKVEELTEEEVEAAVEIVVREWADRMVRIEWEVE